MPKLRVPLGALQVEDDKEVSSQAPLRVPLADLTVEEPTAPPSATPEPRNARGMFPVSSSTTDTPDTPSPLKALLDPYAHPETLTDLARILTLPVDSLRRAFGAALTMGAAKQAAATARAVPGAVVRGAVNATAAAGDMVDPTIIGAVSPRAGKVVEIAQNIRKARAALAPVAAEAPMAAASAAQAPAIAEAVAPTAATPTAVLPFKPPPFNPSKAMQSARDAFKTAGVEPLKAEASNVMELIRSGKAPDAALQIVLKNRPAKAVADIAAEAVARSVPKLTADEVRAGLDLVTKGKTPQQAMDAILTQRKLMTKMGGGAVTDTQARAAIDLRNTRGQIKTPSAQTAEGRKVRY